jgi:hypothetical protein
MPTHLAFLTAEPCTRENMLASQQALLACYIDLLRNRTGTFNLLVTTGKPNCLL